MLEYVCLYALDLLPTKWIQLYSQSRPQHTPDLYLSHSIMEAHMFKLIQINILIS